MTIAAFIILGPLAAVVLALLVPRAARTLALAGAATSLTAAVITLTRVADGSRFDASLPYFPDIRMRLVIVPLTAALSVTVATVSALVLIYAVGYMRGESGQPRFFAVMSFFAAAMQTLVLAGDWILFLSAWELIGLASYLLIGFWFERPGVPNAATRAFLVTRAADVGLYVGVIILIGRSGTTVIAQANGPEGAATTIAGLALLLAAMGKSAQAPIQGWLQDAMAGPTPVSALLHSATLVIAGVVLLARAFPLLTDDLRLIVGLVGGITALVTGLMAMTQRDLKRMLASSTSSQVGLMFLGLGAGSVGATVFHLITQAAIKSTLFLSAGVFQHARGSTNFDDLRGIGRERRWVFVAFVIAGLALAGVPPLAGFWSKDAIIAAAFQSAYRWPFATLALLGATLTGVYIARAIRLLWEASNDRIASEEVRGTGWMAIGVALLATLAATLGVLTRALPRFLDIELQEETIGIALGIVAAIAGLAFGWQPSAARALGPVRQLAERGFRIGGGLEAFVARPALVLARVADRVDGAVHWFVLGVAAAALGVSLGAHRVDAGVHRVVEGVGETGMATGRATRVTDDAGIDAFINGLVSRTRALGRQARQLQTGLVYRELAVAAIGAAMLAVVVLLGREG